MPKKVKHRKWHRGGKIRGNATRGIAISFGSFGLKALQGGLITARQIEAARRAMTRYIQRGGKVWIRIFPSKSVTKKPAETRMGGGKGAPDHWVSVVKAGRVMFEVAGITEVTAKEALRLAAHKLPINTRLIVREGLQTGS